MPYHHGNLREALVSAAAGLAAADGPDAVSLREVARQVGVSHNAAYRHFADRDALMRAVAARAMTRFGALMARRIDEAAGLVDDGVDSAYVQFAACGRAYVEFATEQTGSFRAATSFPLGTVQPDDDSVAHPYTQLSRRLDELVTVGAITPERRAHAEIAAFSAVHGLAVLWLDGIFTGDDVTDAAARRERDLVEVLRVVREGI